MPRREIELPSVPGILSADHVLATGRSIARMQEPSGAIPWPDGHTDAWDHVECAMALTVCGLATASRRAYEWLRRSQRSDGAWPKKTVSGRVTDSAVESNQVAYVAVGVWHELQVTGDDGFAVRMWPTVRQAIRFVLRLQTERGEIIWERKADGSPASYALLTGCSSTYQSLRCAVALAEYLGEPQPDWELAADQLGHVIIEHPEAFADKSQFSMDWYYPVLGGAVRGDAARRRLASGWAEFVVPDLGVRCVSDEPWITGAETCELVLALDAIGDRERALAVYDAVQHLRDTSGAYWTGWQFENREHFPAERSSWTAAAVVLAADALSAASAGSDLFRKAGSIRLPDVPAPDVRAPVGVPGLAADATGCGCATP
ncbi:MAG: prenyltransferase [Micromonosporaceae bacterium]